MRSKVLDVRCGDGTTYTWRDDHVTSANHVGRNLLPPSTGDSLSREVEAFRASVAGTGPRMTVDPRLSVGIGRLLDEIGRNLAS